MCRNVKHDDDVVILLTSFTEAIKKANIQPVGATVLSHECVSRMVTHEYDAVRTILECILYFHDIFEY